MKQVKPSQQLNRKKENCWPQALILFPSATHNLVLDHPAVLKVCRYVGHHAQRLLSSNPSLIASNRNSLAVVAYQILTLAHDYSLLMALKRITKVLTTSSTTALEYSLGSLASCLTTV